MSDIAPPPDEGWLEIAICPYLSMQDGAACDLWVQLFSREPKAKTFLGCYWAKPYALTVGTVNGTITVPKAGWATNDDHILFARPTHWRPRIAVTGSTP